MSIIQEALRRKAEDPNAPPPFPVAPPPQTPSPDPPCRGRRIAVVLMVVLLVLAAGVGGAFVLVRLGLRSWMNTVADHIVVEFEPLSAETGEATIPEEPVETPAAPVPAPPQPEPRPLASAEVEPVTWPRLSLTGLIAPQAGRGGAALFREVGVLGEGESFRGVRVVEVRPEGITLEYQGQLLWLREGQSTTDER